MRKNHKQKRRSCALCKPHKVGWDSRWTAKEAALRKVLEIESRTISDEDLVDLIDSQDALADMEDALLAHSPTLRKKIEEGLKDIRAGRAMSLSDYKTKRNRRKVRTA